MREIEKEYVRRIDYRFDKSDSKTKHIFNTVTEILFKEFQKNVSFMELRENLENIINGNFNCFSQEDIIRLNILKSNYNIEYGFDGKTVSVFDEIQIYDYEQNDIVNSIRKVVMAPQNENYVKIIYYYLIYFYLKSFYGVEKYEFLYDKLRESFDNEIKYTFNFIKLLKDKDNLINKYNKNGMILELLRFADYRSNNVNNNDINYSKKLNDLAMNCLKHEHKYTDTQSVANLVSNTININEKCIDKPAIIK